MNQETVQLAGAQQAAKKPDASTALAFSRTLAAHERTMLAWIRTATSLITFGFSIQQFFRNLRSGAERADRLVGPNEVGLAMIVIGLCALLLATLDHHSAVRELSRQFPVRSGFPEVPRSRAQALAALIGLLGVLALLAMFLRR